MAPAKCPRSRLGENAGHQSVDSRFVLAVSLNSVSLLVGVIGGLVAAGGVVVEYVLKSRSQRAELDIKLAGLFAEIVPIANGRPPGGSSESVVAKLVASGVDAQEAVDAARPVVGAATQAGAIRSLGYLGWRYPALRDPARASLKGLRDSFANTNLHQTCTDALAKVDSPPRNWWQRLVTPADEPRDCR